ncbi:hypothetical protein DL96DRAFT_1717034 [Flagelloscypha sp. PMI_526]|nr:hypothetical protein DL96DRAFT_1717034 [Flagelloscypha sp. PMI_526]
MSLNEELLTELWQEIFSILDIPDIVRCASLAKCFLPLLQQRLYRSLDVNLANVGYISTHSLHLLIHTRTLRTQYTHDAEYIAFLPGFFECLSLLGQLRSLTFLVLPPGWDHASSLQPDTEFLYAQFQHALLSIKSLNEISVNIDPPRSSERTYLSFLETTLVHPALYSLWVTPSKLPSITFPNSITSSPFHHLHISAYTFLENMNHVKRIFRHINLSRLQRLVIHSGRHLTQEVSSALYDLLKGPSLEDLVLDPVRVEVLPFILAIMGPSKNLRFKLLDPFHKENWTSMLTMIAKSFDSLPRTSLTSVYVVIRCKSVTNPLTRLQTLEICDSHWDVLGRALKRFTALIRVTIHFTTDRDSKMPVSPYDRERAYDALKHEIPCRCSLELVDGRAPSLD